MVADISYRTELADNTQVTVFDDQIVELRQGPGQSVQFNIEDIEQLIDELIAIRDEEY